jgi:hypothetical protein
MPYNPLTLESNAELRPLWAALRRTLRLAKLTRDYRSDSIQNATIAFATVARRLDVPPETLLVLLKRAAVDDGLSGLSDFWREVIVSRLVRWGIEGYYAEAQARPDIELASLGEDGTPESAAPNRKRRRAAEQ